LVEQGEIVEEEQSQVLILRPPIGLYFDEQVDSSGQFPPFLQ
jgi:hypothetical protein